MNNINYFINNRMKVLLIIYNNQVKLDNLTFCPLSQQEISNLVPCSKLITNQIIKDLKNEGYVDMLRCRGRYCLLKKGEDIVQKLIK